MEYLQLFQEGVKIAQRVFPRLCYSTCEDIVAKVLERWDTSPEVRTNALACLRKRVYFEGLKTIEQNKTFCPITTDVAERETDGSELDNELVVAVRVFLESLTEKDRIILLAYAVHGFDGDGRSVYGWASAIAKALKLKPGYVRTRKLRLMSDLEAILTPIVTKRAGAE